MIQIWTDRSKSESLEEESNISCFFVGSGVRQSSESISECFSKLLSKFDSTLAFEVFLLDVFKIKVGAEESSGHDVILVDSLNKDFHASLFDEFLFVDFSLNSLRVSRDSCNKHMWEFVSLNQIKPYLVSFFVVFSDYGFLSRKSAGGKNDNSSWFKADLFNMYILAMLFCDLQILIIFQLKLDLIHINYYSFHINIIKLSIIHQPKLIQFFSIFFLFLSTQLTFWLCISLLPQWSFFALSMFIQIYLMQRQQINPESSSLQQSLNNNEQTHAKRVLSRTNHSRANQLLSPHKKTYYPNQHNHQSSKYQNFSYFSKNKSLTVHEAQKIRIIGQQKILYVRKCIMKKITYKELFENYPYTKIDSFQFPMSQLLTEGKESKGIVIEDGEGIHFVQHVSYIKNRNESSKKPKKQMPETPILNGFSVSVFKNDTVFEGIYHDSNKCGYGYQVNPDGNTYIGFYLHGLKHGRGAFFWFKTGEYYNGQWLSGLPHGQGVYRSPSQDFYQGTFMNGVKYGQGQQVFHNGDKYIGNYVNGIPQGYGEYCWKDGSIFKGDFKNGLRHGYGMWKGPALKNKDRTAKNHAQKVVKQEEEQIYIGQYRMDKKEGFGIYQWSANSQVYKGQFKEDFRQGYGQLLMKDSLGVMKVVYQGGWQKGTKKPDLKVSDSVIKQFRDFLELQQTKLKTKAKIGHKNCIPGN